METSLSNILIKFTGPEATMEYQDDQMCVILKVVIDGAVHEVQSIWDKNSATEDCLFVNVDAKNVFNKINRVIILWKVRHLCSSGARFVLISIVTGHHSFCRTVIGRPDFCKVERVWCKGVLYQ